MYESTRHPNRRRRRPQHRSLRFRRRGLHHCDDTDMSKIERRSRQNKKPKPIVAASFTERGGSLRFASGSSRYQRFDDAS